MSFENDIFISYAHLDNQPLVEGQDGWIANLHRALEIRVSQLVGKQLKIWRDPKLQGNDVFADTLVERLPQVALLVSVFSPRYVESDWCVRELTQFWEAAEAAGGAVIDNKARVFKVVKTPVDLEAQPATVHPLLGYEFFTVDPASGRARELDKIFGPEAEQKFWARLDDLAHDIRDVLNAMEHRASGASAPDADKPRVYLADTTFDLKEDHGTLRRDLQRSGYEVLPDRPLPMIASELEAVVREQLGRCRMSIHLVGRNHGIVPEEGQVSVEASQRDLARERAASRDFAQLTWIPHGIEIEDERQKAYVESIRANPVTHENEDLLETPLEDLKTVVYARLKKMEKPPTQPPPAVPTAGIPGTDSALIRIYLIFDQRDQDDVIELQDYLFDQGYEVILPVFEGDEVEIRELHEENLRDCDAVLLYYGAVEEVWVRRKLRELQKSAGQGRDAPLGAQGIVVAPPSNPQKLRLRTREATVIPCAEGFDAGALAPFLGPLRSSETGTDD